MQNIPKRFDEEMIKHFKLDDQTVVPKGDKIKNILMSIKGIGTDGDDQPKKLIPNNLNQVLAQYIETKSIYLNFKSNKKMLKMMMKMGNQIKETVQKNQSQIDFILINQNRGKKIKRRKVRKRKKSKKRKKKRKKRKIKRIKRRKIRSGV